MAGTNIIRNFDALRRILSIQEEDQIIVGRRIGSRGNLAPKRIGISTFAAEFFGLPTVQTLLCNFLETSIESIGTGIEVYEGFDAVECKAQFRSLTAGTNITLDDTTPGEIIINSTATGGGGDGIYGGSGDLIGPTTVTMNSHQLDFVGGNITMNGLIGIGGGTVPSSQILVTTTKIAGINVGNSGSEANANGIIVRNFSTGGGRHLGLNASAFGAAATQRTGVWGSGGISKVIANLGFVPYNNMGGVFEGYSAIVTDDATGVYSVALSSSGGTNVGGHFRAANGTDNYGLIVEGRTVIGDTTSDASAILELNSTTQGFLPSRMTGLEAEAITTPAEGLLIYSTDSSGVTINSKGWWGYDGTIWNKLN
jgi:hypothetical protein